MKSTRQLFWKFEKLLPHDAFIRGGRIVKFLLESNGGQKYWMQKIWLKRKGEKHEIKFHHAKFFTSTFRHGKFYRNFHAALWARRHVDIRAAVAVSSSTLNLLMDNKGACGSLARLTKVMCFIVMNALGSKILGRLFTATHQTACWNGGNFWTIGEIQQWQRHSVNKFSHVKPIVVGFQAQSQDGLWHLRHTRPN